ncbi:hypothetical protein [Kitasatospora sp. NPDC087315]|uniref:hypothetical protein n=1 Tax=Kitasatospora sp. NPDC087315 TaxID=3364069 RepID=UPI00381D361D
MMEYDGGHDPSLIWQTASSGDICVAEVDGGVTGCSKAVEIEKRPTPGVGTMLRFRLVDSQGRQAWTVLLIAAGESVEKISCRQQDFPVRKAFTASVGGVLRTVYTTVVPRDLPGDYRVDVRRDGQPLADHVVINPEQVAAVQC